MTRRGGGGQSVHVIVTLTTSYIKNVYMCVFVGVKKTPTRVFMRQRRCTLDSGRKDDHVRHCGSV